MTMREKYKNGDEISLVFGGCDGCSPSVINGVFCHEQGCPDAWRDRTKVCDECGFEFQPTEEFQSICDSCQYEDEDSIDYDEYLAMQYEES